MTSAKRQFLLVGDHRCRRNSAPEYLVSQLPKSKSNFDLRDESWQRASVSDLSILLDNQSESGSSLEIDTSNLSRDLSPAPTPRSSYGGSYQTLPIINFEVYRRKNDEDSFLTFFCSRTVWKSVILAQVMAGCLSLMDFSTVNLQKFSDVYLKNGQNLPLYLLLTILWTTRLAWRNDGRGITEVIKLSGLRYVLLSVLHVEANFLLSSSFKFDSYIGNQMIDCVAASLSLVLAYVCLEVQFHLTHVCGFGLGIMGAIGLCFANVWSKKVGEEEEINWGDILRIESGLFLAFNSLAQELIVKSIDSVEYLGMVGLIGSFICGFQSMILEADQILPKSGHYWFSILSFSSVQLFFNCLSPILLRDIGTTGLHLALISSRFYSYLLGMVLNKDKISYFFSYTVIILGSYVFTIKRTTIGKHFFFPVKVIISKGS